MPRTGAAARPAPQVHARCPPARGPGRGRPCRHDVRRPAATENGPAQASAATAPTTADTTPTDPGLGTPVGVTSTYDRPCPGTLPQRASTGIRHSRRSRPRGHDAHRPAARRGGRRHRRTRPMVHRSLRPSTRAPASAAAVDTARLKHGSASRPMPDDRECPCTSRMHPPTTMPAFCSRGGTTAPVWLGPAVSSERGTHRLRPAHGRRTLRGPAAVLPVTAAQVLPPATGRTGQPPPPGRSSRRAARRPGESQPPWSTLVAVTVPSWPALPCTVTGEPALSALAVDFLAMVTFVEPVVFTRTMPLGVWT